jgi:hypothetical protein
VTTESPPLDDPSPTEEGDADERVLHEDQIEKPTILLVDGIVLGGFAVDIKNRKKSTVKSMLSLADGPGSFMEQEMGDLLTKHSFLEAADEKEDDKRAQKRREDRLKRWKQLLANMLAGAVSAPVERHRERKR